MATIVIQYPSGHDFDIDYYVRTHMPLAEKTWKNKGLQSAQVIKLGGDSPYQVYTVMKWESMAHFQAAATAEDAKNVHEDVKNFTTATAEIRVGETIAESKL